MFAKTVDKHFYELLYSISLCFWEASKINYKAVLNAELESLHRTEQHGTGVVNISFSKVEYASQRNV